MSAFYWIFLEGYNDNQREKGFHREALNRIEIVRCCLLLGVNIDQRFQLGEASRDVFFVCVVFF